MYCSERPMLPDAASQRGIVFDLRCLWESPLEFASTPLCLALFVRNVNGAQHCSRKQCSCFYTAFILHPQHGEPYKNPGVLCFVSTYETLRYTHLLIMAFDLELQPPPYEDPRYDGVVLPDYDTIMHCSYDPLDDVNAIIRSSKSNSETFNKTVIKIFSTLNHTQLIRLMSKFNAETSTYFHNFLEKKTSGHFSAVLQAVLQGPVRFDLDLLETAIQSADSEALIEIIIGRESSAICFLDGYRTYGVKELANDIDSAFSGDAKACKMFRMALTCERPPPTDPVDVGKAKLDAIELHNAVTNGGEVNCMKFFNVLINRSTPHISRVIAEYGSQYVSLSKTIKQNFSGIARQGLLHIVHGANPKRDGLGIYRDAKLLHQALNGGRDSGFLQQAKKIVGVLDHDVIVRRIVRLHWDFRRRELVECAYRRRFGTLLTKPVMDATSGAYRDLMLALLDSYKK
ncbi:hypothetical protein BDQ17DRAFT_1346189 [Cyathus striatus]|nr:hypothetical protein BDQ17DRAFT_1346189 [Cyathus striatus]